MCQTATVCIIQLWRGSKNALLIHEEGAAYLRSEEGIVPSVQECSRDGGRILGGWSRGWYSSALPPTQKEHEGSCFIVVNGGRIYSMPQCALHGLTVVYIEWQTGKLKDLDFDERTIIMMAPKTL